MNEKILVLGGHEVKAKPLTAANAVKLRSAAAPLISQLYKSGLEINEAYAVAQNCAVASLVLCGSEYSSPKKVLQSLTLDEIAQIAEQCRNDFSQAFECGENESFGSFGKG
ncbi:MAG TPA: hypothetical protein DCP97_00240 [Ruminococcaceae bacterium]|nr:hypothetical protein [Oscillospiraceae bacterium]